MKTSRSIVVTGALCMLLFSGCLEEQVRTVVAPDGSSRRIISMKLRSQNVPENAFPVPAGEGWTAEWKQSGDTSLPFEYVAQKDFATPEALHNEYLNSGAATPMGLSVSIRKRFQWFFTYYYYGETYSYRNPFGHVPVTEFLAPEEIVRFQQGNQDDTLKGKMTAWEMRDLFEDFFGGLMAEAGQRADSADMLPLLRSKKEDCYNRMIRGGSEKGNTPSPGGQSMDIDEKTGGIDGQTLQMLAEIFGADAAGALRPAIDTAYARTMGKLEIRKVPDAWKNTVELPGMLIDVNSTSIEGNTVTWSFEPDQVKVGPYVMNAASRVANVWAFVATGGIGLLFIGMTFRKRFFRRGSGSLE